MAALIVLFSSAVLFRALGLLLLPDWFGAWVDSARAGLALMFVFTGVSHFTSMQADFVRMVPEVLPAPGFLVSLTGACELLGAAGILFPSTRDTAGICLIILLAVMLPANIRASRKGIRMGGKSPTPLWARIPMQGLLMGLVWWTTQG